ncbi:MAG: HAD-IIIA family hydrolase [Ignavibacteriaceae bacterium]|jgi:YrbI family 3-deoxy-D-manno-octulosonate 8-phosphate phosphatase
MNPTNKLKNNKLSLKNKASAIKLLLTDNDGVLTDTGVYYSAKGEEFKRFSIRDGMGVERLLELAGVETGIITGEKSESVLKRAEKLKIKELYLGVKNKEVLLHKILKIKRLKKENVAFIGDDVNDYSLLKAVGFSASPADGIQEIRDIVDYVCKNKGGNGAFREVAELIIKFKLE